MTILSGQNKHQKIPKLYTQYKAKQGTTAKQIAKVKSSKFD